MKNRGLPTFTRHQNSVMSLQYCKIQRKYTKCELEFITITTILCIVHFWSPKNKTKNLKVFCCSDKGGRNKIVQMHEHGQATAGARPGIESNKMLRVAMGEYEDNNVDDEHIQEKK